MKLLKLIKADIRQLYPQSWARRMKALSNPSIYAVVLVRFCQVSYYSYPLWRILTLLLFGIDVGRGVRIGPGLVMPHPTGIVLGGGVSIGGQVRIYQGVTLGANLSGRYPTIGDQVTIFPGAVVVGGISVGDCAVIGALSYVNKDVAKGEVVRR